MHTTVLPPLEKIKQKSEKKIIFDYRKILENGYKKYKINPSKENDLSQNHDVYLLEAKKGNHLG